MEDLIKIYLNQDVKISEKKQHFINKRRHNVHEFGNLVLSLLFAEADTLRLVNDQDYRKYVYNIIFDNISKEM